ncbi:MAG: hypothetical protein IKP47_02845 [Ruminococcus sp.]|nr:hypothetical protein [Ruminococcus sp.]
MTKKNRIVKAGIAAVLALSLMIPIAVSAADKEAPETEQNAEVREAESTAPELETEAAPEPGTETAPELETEAAPEPGTETAPELETEAAPEPGTEEAPSVGDYDLEDPVEDGGEDIKAALDKLEELFGEDLDDLKEKGQEAADGLLEKYQDKLGEYVGDEDWNELVNGFADLIKDIDLGELIYGIGDMFGIEYGELTQAEITELKGIWTRIGNIGGEMIADIFKNAGTLTEEQIEQKYAQYEDELNRLTARAEELEKKAGWEDYADDWDWGFDDDDWDWDFDGEDCDASFDFDISDEDLTELGALLEELFGSMDTANI